MSRWVVFGKISRKLSAEAGAGGRDVPSRGWGDFDRKEAGAFSQCLHAKNSSHKGSSYAEK